MDWLKVTIYTTSEGIDPLSGRLYGLGITGLEIEDERDFKDFLENNKQYWDYVDEDLIKEKSGETKVSVYVNDNAAGNEMIIAIKGELAALKALDADGEFGRLEYEINGVRDEDWQNNWKKYYHTMEIGERVIIKPVWEDFPAERGGKVVFNIEPGLSFGTGSHETTRLCIESLEKYVKPGMKILDLGCGSGILSIIALLLGAESADAIDIDPNAVGTARQNARRNGIDDSRYTLYAGDILTDKSIQGKLGEYDIVLANIVADVIIALSPAAKKYMKDGGVFITSGIIESRTDDVKTALDAAGFKTVSERRQKDWVSIVCK
ncbi:MAG: 50S ribosomal protein L11 methyltransferase [Firmicutes bacterium]|nr:50S ribosomal protein L11 methyltransferase [Bacillota bacterium]